MTQQVALVTGASGGIGRATALALAEASFFVALNDFRPSEALNDLGVEIESMGGKTCEAIFDVSDIDAHEDALKRIAATLGPVTTLVNNAGVSVINRGDILDAGEQSFDRCMTVNAKALFFLCQAFSKTLLARERAQECTHAIINVTSSNATAVAVPRAEYCASKSAAAMISKCFAARLAPENIAVYDVQPGLIETPMTQAVIKSYKDRAAAGLCLYPRVGQPEEVAQVIVSLATDCLPYTTGHVISVDGGMLVPRF